MYFEVIRYIISSFGMLYREKSGNPDADPVTYTQQTNLTRDRLI
jgi:hypothetical protein